MRAPLLLAAVAIVVASAPPCHAAFKDGNDLYHDCSTSSAVDHGVCLGYIEGVADILSGSVTLFGWRACIPQEAQAQRLSNVVLNFLSAHPEIRHNAAPSLVAAALASDFPCR